MGRRRFHNLKRPKIRADWSKWTLYNLAQMRPPSLMYKTFFQQKWKSKSITRAYHGNQVREKKWEIMFDRRLPAVVPMDPLKLALSDGSEQGAGRGSGRDDLLQKRNQKRITNQKVVNYPVPATPYNYMTYWPIERRLDTAIWRSLFASSALQARQFVVHGGVKVNGKKIRHPGYLLNPGDMFQVEPERVLYATGARKFDKNNPSSDPRKSAYEEDEPAEAQELPDNEEESVEAEASTEADANESNAETSTVEATETAQDPKKALKKLTAQAKDILADPTEKAKMSAKQKQAMRSFKREVMRTMSRIRGDDSPEDTVEALEATMDKLLKGETPKPPSKDTSAGTESEDSAQDEDGQEGQKQENVDETAKEEGAEDEGAQESISPRRDAQLLREALDRAEQRAEAEAEVDASKPYATPWRPRPYMSAFAFVPRYLEVNHKICSAVYLRHPVARPGFAEVPSPFNEEVYELAHNWYLRRR